MKWRANLGKSRDHCCDLETAKVPLLAMQLQVQDWLLIFWMAGNCACAETSWTRLEPAEWQVRVWFTYIIHNMIIRVSSRFFPFLPDSSCFLPFLPSSSRFFLFLPISSSFFPLLPVSSNLSPFLPVSSCLFRKSVSYRFFHFFLGYLLLLFFFLFVF